LNINSKLDLAVSKEYKKKASFEVGWNNKLFDLLDNYLNDVKKEKISFTFKNQIAQSLGKNKLLEYDFIVEELNIEYIICQLISKFYLQHKEIFQTDNSIGAIGITAVEDSYRIILVLG